MIGEALRPFIAADSPRLSLIGENVRFQPKTALALSIVFNELGTNALKYGALSNAEGIVRIERNTRVAPGGSHIVLKWQETGGPPVRPRSYKGFGSNAIERGLTHELGADVRLDYRPEGVVCTIDIPAPDGGAGG